ncbi:chaperone protein dnaJ 49 [Artemisia annua]|uniref:Chaperone protein dnaJ 49 n=1 Tax=Artemisia annua TaxID=35608 RepID=A0A2U1QMM3_ARTAN|nr:chaperone protein dnaJ 49 [Artemisia annua]
MACKKLKAIAITPAFGALRFFGDTLYDTLYIFADPSVRLVSKINRTTDYYQILGLRKKCSAEEIRKAYNRISLMVHPDKNKARGSEEAFKKVNKAYQCLIDEYSRKCYDTRCEREREHNKSICLVCIIVTWIIVGAVCLDIAIMKQKAPYKMRMYNEYQLPKMTTEYRIEFYVESSNEFDEKYPLGSRARADIENTITKDYICMLRHDCYYEQRRRSQRRDFPTPQCDKLQSLGMHEQG